MSKVEKELKVNLYSTFCSGGAGQAVIRFARQYGIMSQDYILHTKKGEVDGLNIRNHRIEPVSRLRRVKRRFQRDKVFPKGEYEIVSEYNNNYTVENGIDGGIHHLHWIANFINWKNFFPALSSPVVWTLHDMNPFLGVFHYKNDVIANPKWKSIEEETRIAKFKAFSARKVEAVIVTPSKWMMEESLNSKIFKELPHHHICNGIDLKLFKPLDTNFCKSYLNLRLDQPTLLFAAEVVSNKRKGFDLLLNILPELLKHDIQLVAIGRNSPKMKDIKHLGNIQDEKLMPLVFNACDAFVLPSREDNLPNTMVEAMACGKPVIAFNTGGMVENIDEAYNGYVANELRSEDLFDAIMRWRKTWSESQRTGECSPESIRKYAEREFDVIKQSEKYFQLYKSLEG